MSDASGNAQANSRVPRLIKRYANRKMYDTEKSCYITLEEVAEMVRAGEDLRVIDNKTKSDLTEVTLTQALLNSERRKRGSVSIDGLKNLFAQGGELLQSRVGAPVSRVANEAEKTVEKWRNEAERTVGRVLSKKDVVAGSDISEPSAEAAAAVKAPVVEAHEEEASKKTPPSFVENTQRAYDEWQTRIDERVRLLVSALTVPGHDEDHVIGLLDRVAQLEERVAQLEKQLRARAETASAPRGESEPDEAP